MKPGTGSCIDGSGCEQGPGVLGLLGFEIWGFEA